MSGSTTGVPAFDFTSLGSGFNYIQGSYSLGYQFSVSQNLVVTALGFYDALDAPLSGAHTVTIFDDQTHQAIASASVTNSSQLIDLFRYTTISPVTLVAGDTYDIETVNGNDQYAVGVLSTSEVIAPGVTYIKNNDAGLAPVGSNPVFPTGQTGSTSGDETGDFGPNFLVQEAATTPTLIVPPTSENIADTLYNSTTMMSQSVEDTLTYQVAAPPQPGVIGANGFYHYSYSFSYMGSPTLIIPLFHSGDVQNLAGGTLAPYNTLSGSIQQDFGTEYGAAITVALPSMPNGGSQTVTFDSIYAPSQVTTALVGTDGVIHLVDPPIPNNSTSSLTATQPAGLLAASGAAATALGIVLADTAAVAATTVTAVLTDKSGVLGATASPGGQVSPAAGSATLTLTGSLAAVNAELASLTYTGAANGADAISLTATDSLGNKLAQNEVAHVLAFGNAAAASAGSQLLAADTFTSAALVDVAGASTLASGQTSAVVDAAGATTLIGNAAVGEAIAAGSSAFAFAAGSGSGTIAAGAGADSLLLGGGGNWFAALGNGADTIVAAAGNDTLSSGSGGTLLFLGAGASSLVSGGADTIIGGAGASTINGGTDLMFGGAGAIDFNAGAGSSTLVSGSGGATVTGSAQPLLYFGGGPTIYRPGTAVDTVLGFNGTLTATGGANGTLFFTGTAGGSNVSTGPGSSTIIGFGASDTLTATGNGNDVIAAAGATETVNGAASTGTNTFFAFAANDVLIGGSGPTALESAIGNQTLVAGSGTTLIEILAGTANRSITIGNFNSAQDFVQLQGYGAGAAAAALANAQTVAGSETLALADGTTITFQGVTRLSASSFV